MTYTMSIGIQSLRLEGANRLELADKVHAGLSSARVRRFLHVTGMTQEQLFLAAHIPVSTGRRRLAGKTFPDHESERIARIARVYDEAALVFRRPGRATGWLHEANPRLGGRRPIDAAGTELGAAEVEAVLGRLAHGVH